MTDWFGGIGKDLSGFVGEVTKQVQTQVSQLQQANEEEQKSSHEPYGAFAPNESVLDSFFTTSTYDNDAPKQENTDATDNTQQAPMHHLSSPSPRGRSTTPTIMSVSPKANPNKPNPSDIDVSGDENRTNNELEDKETEHIQTEQQQPLNDQQDTVLSNIDNAEKVHVDGDVVEPNKSVANDTDNTKYQTLLDEKKQGDAKYKQLKSKFGKLHSKYKQNKEQNEKQHTLNDALKNNLNEMSKIHRTEIEELKKQFEVEKNTLNEKINNKQSKIEQLVKELNEQALIIEKNDVSIKKYESEGNTYDISIKKYESEDNILRNKVETLNTELTDHKSIINDLNQQLNVFKQENEELKTKINDLKQNIETHSNDKDKQTETQMEPQPSKDELVEQKEGGDPGSSNEDITSPQGLVSPSPSYVKVGGSESLLFISTQEMESMTKKYTEEMESLKKKYTEEIANWKLMYEEIEKTAFTAVQDRNKDRKQMDELTEETDRLQHNLILREEQLEKANIKLANYLKDIEENENIMDKYKKTIHSLNEQNTLNVSDVKWKKIIKEKDAEIEDIMKEGEEWASNCHNLESKIKKLLEELTDKRDDIDDLNIKLSKKEERITNLLENINSKKSDSDSIFERNKLLIKHNEDTKVENVQLMEQIIALKTKMKHIESERDEYVEMIEEHKEIVSKLNIEMATEREHIESYNKGKQKESHLLNELTELRDEMQRIQSVERKKYERLLREKDDEKGLRINAEKRNEELSLEIGLSTQPLLRQIESLKNSQNQRKRIWENLESDLRIKIRNLENDLNNKENKINKICSDLEDLKINENKMEITNKRLKEENRNNKHKTNELTDKLDEIQIKYEDLLTDKDIYKNKAINLQNNNKNITNQLKKFNKDYKNERDRLQNILKEESKKREELQNTITILQQKLRQKQENNNNNNDIIFTQTNNNNMWTVSRIQNELRQKENELKSLKQRLINIQTTNETFSDEIVKLKSKNETLTKYHVLYKNQSKQINALRLRYEAAIDIVIEKEKQIQQLTNS